MKRILEAVCLLTLACGMLAGCTKDAGERNAVKFTVSSSPVATRTSYSGKGETQSGVLVRERIDWTRGDIFTVKSDNAYFLDDKDRHWANYRVDDYGILSSDVGTSRAAISPVDANSLQWGDRRDHVFIARYPAARESAISYDDRNSRWCIDFAQPYQQQLVNTSENSFHIFIVTQKNGGA